MSILEVRPCKFKRFEDDIPENVLNYFTNGIREEINYCLPFWVEHHLRACQSPIEMLMLIGLYRYMILSFPRVSIVEIINQYPEGPYRIDLALGVFYEGNKYKLAIECDGHNYHEKTEVQARHNKKRDRYLQSKGWFVARFTGKEIVENPKKCAEQAIELISDYDLEIFLNSI